MLCIVHSSVYTKPLVLESHVSPTLRLPWSNLIGDSMHFDVFMLHSIIVSNYHRVEFDPSNDSDSTVSSISISALLFVEL